MCSVFSWHVVTQRFVFSVRLYISPSKPPSPNCGGIRVAGPAHLLNKTPREWPDGLKSNGIILMNNNDLLMASHASWCRGLAGDERGNTFYCRIFDSSPGREFCAYMYKWSPSPWWQAPLIQRPLVPTDRRRCQAIHDEMLRYSYE